MDHAESVSRGCFAYKAKGKKRVARAEDYLPTNSAGANVSLQYEIFQQVWEDVDTEIQLLKWRLERKYYNAQLMPSDTGCIMWLPLMRKERWGWGPLIFEILQSDLNSKLFDDLLAFIGRSRLRSQRQGSVREIPAAALITGVNTPDHGVMFANLGGMVRERVSPLVASVQAKDCSSVKALLSRILAQILARPELASLEDSEDLSGVGSQACSMMTLVRHYMSLCRTMEADSCRCSPKKSSPKKSRLSTDHSPTPAITIILEDTENFSPSVLQDFIVTCSNYIDRLPLVLVLGIATSVTTVHRLLPTAVSSLLCMEKFQIPPSTQYLSLMIDKILMTNKFPFRLGPKVFQLLLDMFLCHHFSVLNFVTAFQYCMMEHYTSTPLSQLCCPQDCVPQVVKKLSSKDVQRLQQLPSVMRHIEQLPRPQLASILQSEDNFKKLIQQLLEQNHEVQHRSSAILQLLHSLTSHLPGRPLGRHIRELYALCLEKDIEETEGFTRAFELLGLTARDELTTLVTDCTGHLKDSTDKCLTDVCAKLDRFVYLLQHLEEEHLEEAENSHEGKDLKLQRTDLRSLQKKLQEMSKKKRVTPYERVRQELLSEVKEIVRTYLLKCESMVLYEVLFYDDVATIKRHVYASPRSAIHQALSNPVHYLQCSCCDADDGSISPTMPDMCIAYKLHLECGQLINLYDWLQAFASIVTAEERENKKPSKPDKVLQARFIQAVSELQFLGFIKPTKRKTDHVARLTWGGC